MNYLCFVCPLRGCYMIACLKQPPFGMENALQRSAVLVGYMLKFQACFGGSCETGIVPLFAREGVGTEATWLGGRNGAAVHALALCGPQCRGCHRPGWGFSR